MFVCFNLLSNLDETFCKVYFFGMHPLMTFLRVQSWSGHSLSRVVLLLPGLILTDSSPALLNVLILLTSHPAVNLHQLPNDCSSVFESPSGCKLLQCLIQLKEITIFGSVFEANFNSMRTLLRSLFLVLSRRLLVHLQFSLLLSWSYQAPTKCLPSNSSLVFRVF